MNRGVGLAVLLAALMAWGKSGSKASEDAVDDAPESKGKEEPPALTSVGPKLLAQHLGLTCVSNAQIEESLRGEFDLPEILIATLPDPLASHLDWAFDSHLDAIRRACERAGYVLDRFELPWDPAATGTPKLPGKPGAMLFREAAGVSLAKKDAKAKAAQAPDAKAPDKKTPERPDLCLVYLIGELSTGGIDREAFDQALDERSSLLKAARGDSVRADEPLAIVGPVFSGSSRSLHEAVKGRGRCDVVSGAATSEHNERIVEGDDWKTIMFRSTLHTDDTLRGVLERDILPPLGLDVRHLVVLQESTTDYGQSSQAKPPSKPPPQSTGGGGKSAQEAEPKPLTIPFPMSIGSLRRAIVRNDPKAADEPSMPGRAARSNVDLELYAERERAETALLASKLSPPTVDLLLEEITRTLVQRDIRAALIFASDVRDKLFLGSELKKRLPALQLVTTESNVLYLRPELNRWLRGMIVLSTYPLLLRDPNWRPHSSTPDELAVFPNEGAEGTFNAVLAQLGREDLVFDYGHPIDGNIRAGGTEKPPVWATVVGAGTMLPLDVFVPQPALSTKDPPPGTSAPTPDVAATGVGAVPENPRDTSSGFLAMLSTSVIAVFLLANIAFFWWIERPGGTGGRAPLFAQRVVRWVIDAFGSTRQSPRVLFQEARAAFDKWRRGLRVADRRDRSLSRRILSALPTSNGSADWRTRQERIERVSLALHYELYTTFLYASLWCLLLPNVLLILLRKPWAIDSLMVARICGYTAIVLGLVALLRRARRALRIATREKAALRAHVREFDWPDRWTWLEWFVEIGMRLGIVVCALAYVAGNLVLAVQIAILKLDRARFALFFHRSIEVDQGVSILVPLGLIGVVLVAWCYWHLSRIHGLATRTPAEVPLHTCSGEAASAVFSSRVREQLFRIVPNLEGIGLFVVLTSAVVWLICQFAWTLDRVVLQSVSSIPAFDLLLRFGAVGAIAGSVWAGYRLQSVWWSFAKNLRDNDSALTAIPFREIKDDLEVRADLALWPGGNARNLLQVAQKCWEQLPQAIGHAPDQVQHLVHRTAIPGVAANCKPPRVERDAEAELMLDALVRWLRSEPHASKAAAERASGADAKTSRPAWRTAIERVVAVEVLLYVEWTVRQLRHLAFFLLLALVLTTILISSYPYQPQQLIQTVSLLVFAGIVLGLVVLIGSMNRNAALSRMAVIEPGQLTWDRTLFTNLALYGLVPLITLISSQNAGLRDLLFDWLKPLVGFLVKA